MTKSFLVFLLAVFTIHLLIFLRLAVRHRTGYNLLAVLTFILLLISTGAHLTWPEVHLGPYPLHTYFKSTAWLTTTMTVIAYIRHRYFK